MDFAQSPKTFFMNLSNLNTIAFQRTTTAKSRNTSLVLEFLNITLLLCCQDKLVQDEKWCRMPLPSFVPLSRENSDISAIGLLSPYPLSYSPSFSSHFPSLVMFVQFRQLSFHERLHDGTTSNAQNHELERSRPVVMLKLNIIVTSMMETSFSTLLKKNTIVIKIEKWQMQVVGPPVIKLQFWKYCGVTSQIEDFHNLGEK